MQVSKLGERELISLLKRTIQDAGVAGSPADVPLGIGDDAALLHTGQDHLLATTDQAIEGVHFLADRVTPLAVGWRSIAVNVSDIAAMGGHPRYALVSLALPSTTPVNWVLQLYQGMADLCSSQGIALVGGDISSAPVRVVSITLLGTARQQPDGRPRLLRRDAARAGDRIAVTGTLGGAAAGRALLYSSIEEDHGGPEELIDAFLRPPLRLEEGRLLLASGVRAAMDVSDGLVVDLARLSAASGLAALLQESALPLHPLLDDSFPTGALDLALTGGEDYELLFTAPAELLERLQAALPCAITEIGEMVASPAGHVTVLDDMGRERFLPHQGWQHF